MNVIMSVLYIERNIVYFVERHLKLCKKILNYFITVIFVKLLIIFSVLAHNEMFRRIP